MVPNRGGRQAAEAWLLEDGRPGRTDGERGIDQADV